MTRGFHRLRFGAGLVAAAIGVASFVSWSLNLGHGLYALIVLLGCAAALTLVGGPERLARTITVTDDLIRIDRFHRIATVVRRPELAGARAEVETDSKGRERAVLVLESRDPVTFFTRHRELRSVRHGKSARVPAGRSADTVVEITEALGGSAAAPRPPR